MIKEYLRGNHVHLLVMGELQFRSGTQHLHNEGGIAISRNPFSGAKEEIQWKGLQGLARVSNLGASKIGASRQVTRTLNADDPTLKTLFAEHQRDIRGRFFRFWGQFYNSDLQPIDPRFHLYTGIGDRLAMNKSGPSSRTLTLMLEDWFVRVWSMDFCRMRIRWLACRTRWQRLPPRFRRWPKRGTDHRHADADMTSVKEVTAEVMRWKLMVLGALGGRSRHACQ
ncbi:hypothetical protein ABID19_002892 [Mesorhizobium robiniae]|uniref:Uncharacterized protein n=1 Tax=Mesorhizobium robiniae TaxID=559315 RepID=A0ABV2GNI6_9HYPH